LHNPSTWYQFKLSVDFDSQKASLFYRNLGNDDWVSINDLQNITTTIGNPSSLNKFYLQTDTLSNDGGYIDDVLLVRGDLQELEAPTSAPTNGPSGAPSGNPSANPSASPSSVPTISTSPPTVVPTELTEKCPLIDPDAYTFGSLGERVNYLGGFTKNYQLCQDDINTQVDEKLKELTNTDSQQTLDIAELRTLFTRFNSSNSQSQDITHLTQQFGNYSMALEMFKTTQADTDASLADLRYDFTTYQVDSAQQFSTLTQTDAAILSDVATLHSSQADTDASVTSLQRNFTSYQGNAAQQFYELTQADADTLTNVTTLQKSLAALEEKLASLNDDDSDDGIHFGGTHIDYATLAIGSITALSVGIIGALSWCLSSAKKDHQELAESTNILAAGLASASHPQLQQLREEVRGKATTLSTLVGQRQNIQHQLNVSLNTRPTEAPDILRTVLDADTAIAAYLNIPIEDRTQRDTSKFTGNIAILSANNRENSPLDLAIQSVRTDISGIQQVIADAQSSVLTVTGEKV